LENETSKTRSLQVAFLLDPPSLKNLQTLLSEIKGSLEYKVKFSDGSTTKYSDDRVLQQALTYHAVNDFVGYQRGPDAVRLQVFALWNVLQRDHIHYSSITTPSAASPSGHVYSQAVRFIDQSIASQQANCVDGSVLLASLLYKIGINPVLVHKPGHMFVGYYLDDAHKQIEFLETTMLGAGHQPTVMKNVAFGGLYPAQGSESWKQFIQAVEYADKTFNTEVQPALQQHRPGYAVVDVALARKGGINAIPRTTRP